VGNDAMPIVYLSVMPRWIKIAGLVILGLLSLPTIFALFCMIFLSDRDVTVLMTFPRGFRGEALIAFDEPSGEHLRWQGKVLHLDFPRSGVLKIRESMDDFPESWRPAYGWDNGQSMPVIENTGEFNPRTENVVSVHGGDFLDNKFMHVFVGTDREYRNFRPVSGGLFEQYQHDVELVRKARS
jgi:hypothetical protein